MSVVDVPSTDCTTLCASASVRVHRTFDQADPCRSNCIRFRVTRHICVKNIVHRILHAVGRPSRCVSADVQIRGAEAVGVEVVHEAGPRARHELRKCCVARRFPQERGNATVGGIESISLEVVKHKGDFRNVCDSEKIRNTGRDGVESIRVSRQPGSCPSFASQPSSCDENGISGVLGHPTVLKAKSCGDRRNFGRNAVGRVVRVGCGNLFRQEWFECNACCLPCICTKKSAKFRPYRKYVQGQ